MLYGKILRSPYAHARILSIDTRHAEELPGVYATMTAADLVPPSGRLVDLAEGVQHNMRFLSNNIMVAEKVRCLTFRQIAARQVATGGLIVGRSGVNPPGAGASMGTHIVDVEVDPADGKN